MKIPVIVTGNTTSAEICVDGEDIKQTFYDLPYEDHSLPGAMAILLRLEKANAIHLVCPIEIRSEYKLT